MRSLPWMVIILIVLTACAKEQVQPQAEEDVKIGFENFLKEKQEQQMALPPPEIQQIPKTVERPKILLDVEIPAGLKEKYGQKITTCFEGEGSVEKVAAVASWCVTQLASDTKDAQLCEQLLTGESKDKCYQTLAKSTRDVSLCQKISDSNLKEACVAVVS